MAKGKNLKKQNYILKNLYSLISYFVVFVSLFIEAIFIRYKVDNFGIGLFGTCFFWILLLGTIFLGPIYYISYKTIKYKKSINQIRNAIQWTKVACAASGALGLIYFFIILILKSYFSKIFGIGSLGNMIFIFSGLSCPFVFANHALIGAYNAFGFSMPVDYSKNAFAISNCIFGIIAALIIGKGGEINSALFHNPNIMSAFYGAGIAIGFLIANVIVLFIQLRLLFIYQKNVERKVIEEFGRKNDKISDQLRGFLSSFGFPVVDAFINIIPILLLFVCMFAFYYKVENASVDIIINDIGIMIIQAGLLFMIPIACAIMLANYSEEILKRAVAKDDRYHGGMRLVFSIKQFISFVSPNIIFVGMVAPMICELFFGKYVENVQIIGVILMVVIALTYLFSAFLKGFEKDSMLLSSRIVGIIAEVIFVFLVLRTHVTVINVLLSYTVYLVAICIFDFVILRKYFVYRKNLIRHLAIPFGALLAFSLIVYLLLYLRNVVGIIIAAIIAYAISFFIHSFILIFGKAVNESELNEYPQKIILLLIGKGLRLFD